MLRNSFALRLLSALLRPRCGLPLGTLARKQPMKYRIASLALALAVVVPPSATLVQAAPPGSSRPEVQQSFRQLMETRACPSCDLAGADLTRTDLKGVNLEGANLAGPNFHWPTCPAPTCAAQTCREPISAGRTWPMPTWKVPTSPTRWWRALSSGQAAKGP